MVRLFSVHSAKKEHKPLKSQNKSEKRNKKLKKSDWRQLPRNARKRKLRPPLLLNNLRQSPS